MNIGLNKIYTGLSISSSCVNAVQVQKNKTGWELLRWAHHPFSQGEQRYSFQNTNAPDFMKLATAISKVIQPMDIKKSAIGLALPCEVIKLSIKNYKNLPETDALITKMIAWEMEKALQLSPASLRTDYYRTELPPKKASARLLAAIGVDAVLNEYESLCSELKLEIRTIAPAALCQLNFYSPVLPTSGIIAFGGLFENFFTLFIIENGQIKFYQGIKKRPVRNYYRNDIDRVLQFYSQENWDKPVETLYIGSQIGDRIKLEPLFKSLANIKTVMPDEHELISLNTDCQKSEIKQGLNTFSTAIGAAQSLAPAETNPFDFLKMWAAKLKGAGTR
ncbi:hypothetical protein QUF90_00125 [Desulfococcaceae bacterium HSG9]|nr:hypothetical protein [Desulfococcaceae bacterium HSG9]